MKRSILVLPMLFVGHAAIAQQQQQQQFVPYTIDAQAQQAIMNYLGDVPAKYAVPLIQQLSQMEQQAVKAAADKEAAERAKKP